MRTKTYLFVFICFAQQLFAQQISYTYDQNGNRESGQLLSEDPEFDLPDTLWIGMDAGTDMLVIKNGGLTSFDWFANAADGWLTLDMTNGSAGDTLTLSFTSSPTNRPRYGIIEFGSETAINSPIEVVVEQEPQPNQSPFLVTEIEDILLPVGFEEFKMNIISHFEDPDDDPLDFSFLFSTDTSVTLTKDGDDLVITEIKDGSTNITVIAFDEFNADDSTEFIITVTNEQINVPPFVVNEIDDIFLQEGFDPFDLDISTVFDDVNDDELTYSIIVSNAGFADIQLEGTNISVNSLSIGETHITLKADDGNEGVASTDFIIHVEDINLSPRVVETIDDIEVDEGFDIFSFYVGDVFEDPDEDEITIEFISSETDIVDIKMNANNLIFDEIPMSFGTTTITLTASDPEGLQETLAFQFTINDVNFPPIVIGEIANVMMITEEEVYQVPLDDVFYDYDDDPLTYSISADDDVIEWSLNSNNLLTISPVNTGFSSVVVVARDVMNLSTATEFEVVIDIPLAVDELSELLVYPNPSDGELHVQNPGSLTQITILSTNGEELVIVASQFHNPIDISMFQDGMYIIKAEKKDGSTTYGKLIKR